MLITKIKMMRKYHLLFFTIILILGCSNNKKPKPNILFIMSDDHAYQAISAYDDKLITTPNIDRIADEGMLFNNACVTNSICAPSRAVILTGKHSHLNGKIDNRSKFDDSQTTFPQLFQKAGYQTAMFGKLHFGNNPKGVDDFLILPGQGDYINPRFLGKDKDTIISGYVTDIITDLTLDWFKNKRDESKPFLMMYLHKAPHRAWWPSPEKFAEFYEKRFPEPKTLFDDYSGRGTAAKTAEMNILKHMQYMHDSKVRPETINEMGDTIKGFASDSDSLHFQHSLVDCVPGSLPVEAFVKGASAIALDADDRFIFDTSNNTLLLDADGNGAGVAVTVATFDNSSLIHSDITIF